MKYSDNPPSYTTRPLTPNQIAELEILVADATDAMRMLFHGLVKTMDLHKNEQLKKAAVAGVFGGVARHIAENVNIVEVEPKESWKSLNTPLKVCQAWSARDMGNHQALETAFMFVQIQSELGQKIDEAETLGAYWRLVERTLPEVSVQARKHLVK